MDPTNLLALIGGSFLGKLEPATLFATALIVLVWWVYRETAWKWIMNK